MYGGERMSLSYAVEQLQTRKEATQLLVIDVVQTGRIYEFLTNVQWAVLCSLSGCLVMDGVGKWQVVIEKWEDSTSLLGKPHR